MSAGRDTGSVTGGSSSAVLDGDGSPLGVCDGGSDDGAALDGAALDGPTLEGAALDGVLPSDGVEQPASSSAPTTSEGRGRGLCASSHEYPSASSIRHAVTAYRAIASVA